MKAVTCDRCGKPISVHDDKARDTIDRENPGCDICENCSLELTLHQEIVRRAEIERKSPQDILKSWLELYELDPNTSEMPEVRHLP